jgi:type III pantothenate kinase
MFLALDIGNTSIKAGIFDGDTLLFSSFIDHPKNPTQKHYQRWLMPLFSRFNIHHIGCASVQPQRIKLLRQSLRKVTHVKPKILSYHDYPNLTLAIDQPEELGIDLVVDGVAANHHYSTPCIVIDVGTATKVMGITKHQFVGVAIAPGIVTSYRALNQHAALIKTKKMLTPQHVFGKNTAQSLASGILLGHVAMIEGLVASGKLALKVTDCPVILTGGYAPLIQPYFQMAIQYDQHLSLKGIRLCKLIA